MIALLRALHAELIKLKRTLAFRMIFVAPLLVALLQFFLTLNQRRTGDGAKLWENLTQNGFAVWGIFLLPLLMTLETALLNGIEHGEKLWKHLFALPLPRYAVYAAKLLIALLLALASTIVLCVLLVLSGYLLMAMKPALANAGAPPYSWLMQHTLKIWVASWLIIALHHWISIRWSSFTIALGAGVAGTFFAIFTASSRVGKYYPWLLPVNSLNVIPGADRGRIALWMGGIGGVIVAVLGCIELVRRDVGDGETTISRKTWLLAGATAIGFAMLGLFLQRPQPSANNASASANPHIARVESSLLSAVSLKGQPRPMKLGDRMAHYNVPGVSIAVINDGKIEWAKGYGVQDADSDKPVTTETRFQAASISKPVAAVAALALVQQGKLNLDEDVNAKLKSWRVPDNEFTRTEKVTLRRLLSHTAGIVEHKYPGYESDAALPTTIQVLDGAKPAITAPIRVERIPGSAFQYSGGGYLITQQLLSDVAGKPFPDLLRELVFQPVGMQHSTFDLPKDWEAFAASGHGRDGNIIKGRWHLHPEMAAAGLWATPTDLARFAIALWQTHKGQTNQILIPDIVRQMMTKQRNEYGLGIVLGGKDKIISFSHDGSNVGYKCAMVMFLETGQGAVVMTNGEHGGNLFGEILRGLAAEYKWPGYRPVEREPVAINPAVLAAYVGEYEFNQQQTQVTIHVSLEQGKLLMQAPTLGGQKMALYPLADNRFFMLEENAEITFHKNAQGAVTTLQAQTANENVTAQKVR